MYVFDHLNCSSRAGKKALVDHECSSSNSPLTQDLVEILRNLSNNEQVHHQEVQQHKPSHNYSAVVNNSLPRSMRICWARGVKRQSKYELRGLLKLGHWLMKVTCESFENRHIRTIFPNPKPIDNDLCLINARNLPRDHLPQHQILHRLIQILD